MVELVRKYGGKSEINFPLVRLNIPTAIRPLMIQLTNKELDR